MKNLLKISLFAFLAIGLFSCEEENDELTGNGKVGGLLERITPAVIYAKGDPTATMSASFSAYQGAKQIKSVTIYKQYTGKINVGMPTETTAKSNKELFRTLDFPLTSQFETTSYNFKYADLAANLVFNGAPMSTTLDDALNIGDFWTLTFVANFQDGSTSHTNVVSTKISVACGSFLSGNYRINNNPALSAVTTALGGGVYKCSRLPYLTAGGQPIPFEFSDTCDVISINTIVLGSYLVLGQGVVNPNGSYTITYALYNGSTPDTGIFFNFNANPATYFPQ